MSLRSCNEKSIVLELTLLRSDGGEIDKEKQRPHCWRYLSVDSFGTLTLCTPAELIGKQMTCDYLTVRFSRCLAKQIIHIISFYDFRILALITQ